jgi:DNA-binding CsgD family transcriptional regulator
VAIDDVQWLDAPSAGAIGFLARRLESDRVTFLLAERSVPNDATEPPLGLGRCLPDDRLERIELGPLSLAAIHRLLQLRLRLSLPRHAASRVYELSGGNAFWALEIGQALLRQGPEAIDQQDLPVPRTMRELVEGRLRDLPRRALEVVLFAGAMHQPTETSIVAGVGASAAEGLQEAVDAGVLLREGDRIRFAHPLLASVPSTDAAPQHRRAIHARLSEVIADPEERARHLALAAEGPDEAVASALASAATLAAARAAMDTAADLAVQAWSLTPAAEDRLRRERALEAIDRLFVAGDLGRASRVVQETLDSAVGGDHAALLFRLAAIRGRTEGPAAEIDLLTAAIPDADTPALKAEIERELAWVGVLSSEGVAFAIEHSTASLRWAELADDRGLQAAALISLAGFRFLHGDGLDLGVFERAASLEQEDVVMSGLHLPLLERGVARGILTKWADDFTSARTVLEERLHHFSQIADESQIPFVCHHLSELECWSGDWEAARRYASEGTRIARLGDQQTVSVVLALSTAWIDALEGAVEPAWEACEEVVALTEGRFVSAFMQGRALLGFIALSVGDREAADRQLGHLTETSDAIQAREPGVIRFQADEIEAAIGVGDLDRAEALTDQLELRGEELDRPWALATGARSRSLVLAARGDRASALETLGRALIHHERLAMPLELGRTLLVKGVLHRRVKQKRASKDALQDALTIFERLGAPLWAEKARSELERVGLRPSAPLGLTPTEERVAALAASGRTNREIAGDLFMSAKTVDSNLGRIYRKLGVRSRTELARRLPFEGNTSAIQADGHGHAPPA